MKHENTQAALSDLTERIDRNETFSVVTVIEEGKPARKLIVQDNVVIVQDDQGAIPEKVQEAVVSLSQKAEDTQADTLLEEVRFDNNTAVIVAVEVIRPKATLIIFGAGHVGNALATLGALTGYEVTVVDDREAFVLRERFPDPRITPIAATFDLAGSTVPISSNSAVVIVTRGHQHDETCLREIIGSRARYIGMIGSKRRVIGVFKRLTNFGVDPELLKRVHAPIGLDIGARSPQEIAVAIMAQIIQTFNSHLKKNWEGIK